MVVVDVLVVVVVEVVGCGRSGASGWLERIAVNVLVVIEEGGTNKARCHGIEEE